MRNKGRHSQEERDGPAAHSAHMRPSPAPHPYLLSHNESGRAGGHEEARDSLVSLGRVDVGEDHEHAGLLRVRDPGQTRVRRVERDGRMNGQGGRRERGGHGGQSFGSDRDRRRAQACRARWTAAAPQACKAACHCAEPCGHIQLSRVPHHILLPLMRKLPSGCLSARVAMANASEPDPASLRQKEPSVSVARRGSQRFFSSSLPHFRMLVLISVF